MSAMIYSLGRKFMKFPYINKQTRTIAETCFNLVIQNAIVLSAMMTILGMSFLSGRLMSYLLESYGVSEGARDFLRQAWFIGFLVVSICVTISGVFATLRLASTEISSFFNDSGDER